MKFEVKKPKIQKGLSYVLKTSVLQQAVESIRLDLHIDLRFISSRENILECFYWLPNENIDYDRFYVRAGTVKSENRKLAENLLHDKVLPKFIDWIIKIKSLPFDSTKLKHNLYFNSVFKNNDIKVFCDEF